MSQLLRQRRVQAVWHVGVTYLDGLAVVLERRNESEKEPATDLAQTQFTLSFPYL